MEFRCRLGTPSGEVIEGVYIAESEARLRREFDEKGLFVLGLHRAGGSRLGVARAAAPRQSLDARVHRLQPGAGDAAQGRDAAGAVAGHPAPPGHQPGLQGGAGRRQRARPGGKLAVRGVRGARHDVSRRLYGVDSGRREERQSRAGHPALRRLRQGRRERQAADDLGAGLPGDPDGAVGGRGVDHHAEGGAGVRRVLRPVRAGAAAVDPRHRLNLELCRHATSWRSWPGRRCWPAASSSGCSGRASASASIG